MNKLLLLLTSTLCTITTHAQSTTYIATAASSSATIKINGVPHKEPPYILADTVEHINYILNEKKTIVSAINSNNDTLWVTNPVKDSHVEKYRVSTPIIVSISLYKVDRPDMKEVIFLAYNNSQFGYIIKKTGEFVFMGQD